MKYLSVLFLALCVISASAGERKILEDQKAWLQMVNTLYHLHWNHFYQFELDLTQGKEFKFRIKSSEGRYFDAFILDEAGLHKYNRLLDTGLGTLDPIILRRRYNDLVFYFTPEYSGRYYLIVDNTRQPDRGHFARMKMNFRFHMWELESMTGRVAAVLLDGKRNFKYWYYDDYMNY